MKPGRQSVILDIITHRNIETQRQLQDALMERGVKSTQATLSRDIKDMRLVKELGPNGSYRYTVSGRSESDDSRQRLQKILRESVSSYQTVGYEVATSWSQHYGKQLILHDKEYDGTGDNGYSHSYQRRT